MERESFEDPGIARILNEHFVPIKVDREERPDIDAMYMNAVQLLTGSGGWPMSVFLTPELKPFWGGTYFPPESRWGRPGFGQICQQLAEAHRTQRDKVEEAARSITEHLAESAGGGAGQDMPGESAIDAAVDHCRRTFDRGYGGFGSAPKFPRSIELSMLLRYHHRTGDPEALEMCQTTLKAMAHGGIHDQIGGGFHRYATDDRWLVPHFEKMLYDNALLARTYLEAFQVTRDPLHARVAREVLEYVLREMTSPDGGFYSATDADSEGEEGKFFVWTPEEVTSLLGADEARVVCERFNITPGGNFEHGKSIPHVTRTCEQVARALRREPGEVEAIVSRGRQALYAAREGRPRPFRDEKVLAAWNGLMISAFARAHQVLDEPRYLAAAEAAARFLRERLTIGGRLHRTHKDGKTQFPAYLDDHAYVAEALLDLYESTFDEVHLQAAAQLMDTLLDEFWDAEGGGFFFTGVRHERLIARRKDPLDNATPSGNGIAALNLLRLERLLGVPKYGERAAELVRGVKVYLERAPMAMGATLIALEQMLHPPLEIALVGDLDSIPGRTLLRAVREPFLPRKIVAGASARRPRPAGAGLPLLSGKAAVDGKPAAYLCKDFACRPPIVDPAELRAALKQP
jgi:hypothetical protein